MQNQHTRRGNTQATVNAANQNKSHSRCCRPQDSGIFNAYRGKKETCPEVFGGPQGLRAFHACCCKIEENSLLNKYVEDPQLQPLGMTSLYDNGLTARGFILRPSSSRSVSMRDIGAARRGFTLIELLVVVLIIGILSAMALPQYQRAVEKSRASSIISTLKTFIQVQETYYYEHGKYANSVEDLDVAFQFEAPFSLDENTLEEGRWVVTNAQKGYSIVASGLHRDTHYSTIVQGRIYCCQTTNSFCEHIGYQKVKETIACANAYWID